MERLEQAQIGTFAALLGQAHAAEQHFRQKGRIMGGFPMCALPSAGPKMALSCCLRSV